VPNATFALPGRSQLRLTASEFVEFPHMEVLPEITPINCYNVERGKLAASVKWLIGRVYGGSAPDLLQNPIRYNDNNTFQLETTVVTALTNSSLYSSAAAKIFKDQNLINQPHGVVLRALANHSIPLMISGEEANISEATLASVQPFHQAAHLAVMDALMSAHMRSIITIERVVDAVQNYTTVDKREEPMDSVDALLFWINKICLLVRDDMEKCQAMRKDPNQFVTMVVPEMEDLYEDMCDGACVCALVAFYKPDEMHMQEICFNDPMSVADCHYNLMLLKRFCGTLSFNPFYFEVEDILYLHESLQPNINAFLADLFDAFESSTTHVASPVDPTPARRFVPIQTIPDLRSQNYPHRALHPIKMKYVQSSASRTMSAMSADSLLTTRSGDSLRYNVPRSRPTLNGTETTNFGELLQASYGDRVNVGADGLPSTPGTYSRSDSMPAASIRLALEEKRREHEKKRYLETNLSESERVQKQKDAFFALMQRLEKQGSDTKTRTMSEVGGSGMPSAREIRTLKETVQDLKKQLQEMSLQQEHLTRQVDGQRQMSHATSQPAIHSDFMYLQDGSQPVLNPYATLPHNVAKAALQQQAQQQHTYAMPYATQMDPMLSSQTIYQTPSQQIPFSIAQQQMDAYSAQLAASSPPQMLAGSQLAPATQIASSPYLQQMTPGAGAMSPFVLHQQPPVALSPPIVTSSLVLPAGASYVNNVPDVNTNTFRLHQNNASSSRLDPPLELKHNLTNWGLTYKAGHMSRPQRRTWENGTFIKSEMDLVNQPEIVPHAPTEQDQMQPLPGSSMPGGVGVTRAQHFHQQRSANDERVYDPQRELQQNISRQIDESDIRPPPPAHQQTPPKDPSSPPTTNTLLMQRHSATGGSQFIVDDIVPDKPAVGVTREMEAKREALLAKTLRRREQIEQRVEEIEARNAERRQAELEKQEAAELRKRERELQRQKILEDYKRKKMERELEANSGFQNGRGHSQPPTPSRPKSTVELAARSRTLQRPTRPQSSIDDTSTPSSARVTVASTTEPALKLFSKYVHKSNRSMIINALQYSVFPGTVSDKMRNEVLGELAKSDSKHFLLLFRDQKCRYMGAYSWDQQSDTAHRIHGRGPNMCHESMMHLMFKYDSGAKTFTRIPTKHLSATIDGFTLQDQFMQTPKIPHSGSISK
uniref:Patronin n=1 Tax=Parascaris univalens TaxID=6257 RepID=A0A915A6K4_PARUN